MLLERTHVDLGWPARSEIFHPSGIGASMVARSASHKLGRSIARLHGGEGVRVGVLTDEPVSTDAPLAVVCEFPAPVPEDTLLQTQRLAWNFSRTPLLVTAEPHVLRVWSCYEIPVVNRDGHRASLGLNLPTHTPEISTLHYEDESERWADPESVGALHWVELVSGHFLRIHESRFIEEKKANRMLLSNLSEIRNRLRMQGLADRYSHDLLARIIFVQFLFDRKDSQGDAALSPQELQELHEIGVLSAPHQSLAEVLSNYNDAYNLFRELNNRFNGDLFPDISPTLTGGEWAEERNHVRPDHLLLLARFVEGHEELFSGQLNLWRLYAFDAIPLDFISSIYEEFVSDKGGTGIHYTKGHLVDFMLDRVLPWDGEQWNLKVLDPACGSGIFLVKAYQRLVERWKRAHPDEAIRIPVLKKLLEENLFGVDEDPNAVRVASFSLYLAMCDEIDPRQYWKHAAVSFPPLRGRTIVCADFFDEDKEGFRTAEDVGTYDIIIGNPPWGDSTLSEPAEKWAKTNGWMLANKDFGTLFVAKAAELASPGGRVCVIQSASALLYNTSSTARRLQERIFLHFRHIDSVTNLAQLPLFKNVQVPTCVLTLRNEPPTGQPFVYECPKKHTPSGDSQRITLDVQDVHSLYPSDVVSEPWVWETLMWGGNRDRVLIRRLNRYDSLETLNQKKEVSSRQGFIRGDHKKEFPVSGRRFLDTEDFPNGELLRLKPEHLPLLKDPYFHSRDTPSLTAFSLPQLIIKTSWVKRAMRFQARMIDVDEPENSEGVICSRSYVTVHGNNDLLETACLVYNSDIANYFLLLTSGRLAFDRTEPYIRILRSVPLPLTKTGPITDIETLSELNQRVYDLYDLSEAERMLVKDLIDYTLPERRIDDPPGRAATLRQGGEPHLVPYCETFRKVVQAAYGQGFQARAELYGEGDDPQLPVRMVRFFFGDGVPDEIDLKTIGSGRLRERLTTLYNLLNQKNGQSIVGRCAQAYEILENNRGKVLAVTLVKPDQVRYWTRSMALRDADELALNLTVWGQSSGGAAIDENREVILE